MSYIERIKYIDTESFLTGLQIVLNGVYNEIHIERPQSTFHRCQS